MSARAEWATKTAAEQKQIVADVRAAITDEAHDRLVVELDKTIAESKQAATYDAAHAPDSVAEEVVADDVERAEAAQRVKEAMPEATKKPASLAHGGGRAIELLRPNGRLIGEAGSSASIRIVEGGEAEARALFDQLAADGRIVENGRYSGTLVSLPGGDTIGFRPVSTSGP